MSEAWGDALAPCRAAPVAGAPWHSLHVFIHDFARLNDFLRHCVAAMPADFLAADVFFIRYWLGGPHVRIRFRGDRHKALLEAQVRAYLDQHAFVSTLDSVSYYQRFASQLHTEPQCYWHGNGEMHYIAYRAEEQRYGGPAGLRLCEDYFVQDSRDVLDMLTAHPDAELEKILFGYCLVQARVLQQFGLYDAYLQATCGVGSREELARYLDSKAGATLAGLRPRLLALRARWLAGDYYPTRLQPLFARLHALTGALAAVAPAATPLILHSVLHMSFNRAGITPTKEETVRLFALYLNNEDHEHEFPANPD